MHNGIIYAYYVSPGNELLTIILLKIYFLKNIAHTLYIPHLVSPTVTQKSTNQLIGNNIQNDSWPKITKSYQCFKNNLEKHSSLSLSTPPKLRFRKRKQFGAKIRGVKPCTLDVYAEVCTASRISVRVHTTLYGGTIFTQKSAKLKTYWNFQAT